MRFLETFVTLGGFFYVDITRVHLSCRAGDGRNLPAAENPAYYRNAGGWDSAWTVAGKKAIKEFQYGLLAGLLAEWVRSSGEIPQQVELE